MNRQEIRDKFRSENPEVTERVITDPTLNSWLLTANEEVACATRCIVSNETEVFDSEEDVQFYDLEASIQNFYDIDDMPGGGAYYDNIPLTKTTPGEMNGKVRGWKNSTSGTPTRYWQRGKYLWLYKKPDEDDVEIGVDCILRPNDFDDDDEEPFNNLGHLQVYSEALVKYVQWRVKSKIGKPDEAAIARRDYDNYVSWMKKTVGGSKYGPISIQPRK